ncbi:MAG: TIGR03546 family protein [Planctomycetota bacterium]|jgi:uncharacterized protein (TIGR03546 family)
MFSILRPLRLVRRLFTAQATPRRLSLGFALGMVIGLVPKGNLIAVSLVVILLATRVNLVAGAIGVVLFSWVAALLDPLSHRIGHALLGAGFLQPTWATLYDLPLVPWTAFNNTVVLGSLLLGLWLFYPVYRLSEGACARWKPPAAEFLGRYRIVRLLTGVQTATDGRPQ